METLKKSEQFESLSEYIAQIPIKTKRRVETRVRIANRIEDTLDRLGITKSKFAKMVERSPSEVTRWLSGDHNFTIDTLTDIEHALNITLLCVTDDQNIVIISQMQTFTAQMSHNFLVTSNSLDLLRNALEWNHPNSDLARDKRRISSLSEITLFESCSV